MDGLFSMGPTPSRLIFGQAISVISLYNIFATLLLLQISVASQTFQWVPEVRDIPEMRIFELLQEVTGNIILLRLPGKL